MNRLPIIFFSVLICQILAVGTLGAQKFKSKRTKTLKRVTDMPC